MAAPGDPIVASLRERGIGALFGDLTRETSRLFRQEVALAKAEISDHVGRIGAGLAMLVAGGVVLFAAVLALLAAAILALAIVLPPWLAALIVAMVVAAMGVALVLIGRRAMTSRNLVPRRTLRTLRDDARWAVDHADRARGHTP